MNYVGIELSLDGFAIEADGDLAAAVKAVRSASQATADPDRKRRRRLWMPHWTLLKGEHALICTADASNLAAMADLAKKHGAALAVKGEFARRPGRLDPASAVARAWKTSSSTWAARTWAKR